MQQNRGTTDLIEVLAAVVRGGVGGLSGQRGKVVPASSPPGAEVVGYPDHRGRGFLVRFYPRNRFR